MRTGYFPDFYPDELVYSVVARYIDHMNFPSHHRACELFFGSYDTGAMIDLPINLNHFISALPPYHDYTIDAIIDGHTLFPYYAHFLSQERRLMLRENMKIPGKPMTQILAGIQTSKIKKPMRLRYCPICASNDLESFGESYWHRSHQLPGIPFCPLHGVLIEETNVTVNNGLADTQFTAAQGVIQYVSPKPISPLFYHQASCIATNALWLLTDHSFQEDTFLPDQYYAYLENKRLVTANDYIRITRLFAELAELYPPDFLRLLQTDFPLHWMARVRQAIVKKNYNSVHPLVHLLLINFLESDINEFFSTKLERRMPFGEGPWPCLNPHCTLYKTNCIVTHTITSVAVDRLSAEFSCQCGYIYVRVGPDRCFEDRFSGWVSCFGHVWDKKLKLLWNDPLRYPLSQISKMMGEGYRVVRKRAAQLSLSFDSPIKRGQSPILQPDFSSEKREVMRKEWLDLIKENPGKRIRELRSISERSYKWLTKHDRKWLHDNLQLPADLHIVQSAQAQATIQKQFQARIVHTDRELAEAINHKAREILSRDELPQKITRFTFCREIGFPFIYAQAELGEEMVLTKQAFETNVETNAQYFTRKLKWASQYFCESHIWPTFVQFYRYARIAGSTIRQRKEIRQIAIDEYYLLACMLGVSHNVQML